MDSLLAVAIIMLLILANGLFVAAEFAIVAAPRLSMESRARRGERLARAVQRVLDDPREQDRFIATAQLGITAASLGLGMYGEAVLAEWILGMLETYGPAEWAAAHAVATIASLTILTYFHIVVGEMVPKSLALQRAERTVLLITLPMLWTKALFYPLVIGLNNIGTFILRLMGIDRQTATHERYYTPEELELVVQESQEAGALPVESGRLLREVLAFGDLTAGQVMAPRVKITGIPVGAGPADIEPLLRSNPHTRYPIYQGDLDHTIGMLHVKDVLRLMLERTPIEAHHARPMPTVPETAPLDAVLGAMRRNRSQIALVIDEYGGTAGIVTLQDLFEELVGEVHDTPVTVLDVYTDAAGRLHVPGTMRLDELGERLGVVLEHEDVDSVSGLVLALLGRPPHVGDSVRHEGLLFEVTVVRGHGVEQCAVVRAI
jgi:CBS domain containing-hemolysin-like protein